MYIKEFKRRIIQLEEIINKIEKELPRFPQGNLRIQAKQGYPQYFHVTDNGNAHGTYITVDNKKLAEKLAQKNYYEKLLKEAKREYKAISSYLKGMNGNCPEEVYLSMNEYRRNLITPWLISDEEYAKQWESDPYIKSSYKPEECIYPTDKGDLVRSKTEARIADMYYALGIPYRYEAQLILTYNKIKYPDFTILKLPERKVYYHEHMGCMEDETYRIANIKKINEYAEVGILPGINLILTFETSYSQLNIPALKIHFNKFFLEG